MHGEFPVSANKIKKSRKKIRQHYLDLKKAQEMNTAAYHMRFMEKASKPFFAKEKQMRKQGHDAKYISALKDMKADSPTQGRTFYDTAAMLKKVALPFYKDLFGHKKINVAAQKDLDKLPLPQVPQHVNDELKSGLTVKKIKKAIDELGNGKAPGSDGISIFFYKKFQGILAPALLHLYNSSKGKSLPNSTKSTVTT